MRIDARAADRPLPPVGDTISIATWNVGYGGLGADSDFFADGGRSVLPPSGASVDRNLAAQRTALQALDADALLLQELARRGPLTRGRDPLGSADRALAGHARWFAPDLVSVVGLRHGHGLFARVAVDRVDWVPLPRERRGASAWLGRRYGALSARLDPTPEARGRWTIIGVHFAAFDPRAETRRRQLERVSALAAAAAAAGDWVVVGGDFNLRLADVEWPSTTPPRCSGWTHRFPIDALPTGFRVAADPTRPTVRSLDRPFRPGENWRGVIDGFLVGPGVDAVEVRGVDLGFEASDHNPVRAVFQGV